MAKAWAKPFYNSKEWKEVREYCLMRDNYLCQDCKIKPAEEVHHIIHLTEENINDNNIAMSPYNLVCLCKDCHFARHDTDRMVGINPNINKDILKVQYTFDDDGQLVRINQ